jgi:predicted ATPase
MSEVNYNPELVEAKPSRFIMISGCSGGGKSLLLGELASRGHRVFYEPGRQIVKEQLHIAGPALPWTDPDLFIDLVISRAMHQMVIAARSEGLSFFDRGIVDAYNHFRNRGGPVPDYVSNCVHKYRYNQRVFFAPPWPEIYRTDTERKHSLEDAVREYERLLATYRSLGYEIVLLPKVDVASRADFILDSCHHCQRSP